MAKPHASGELASINKIPFGTGPNYLESGYMNESASKAIVVVKLDEAARRLGCHVETLRVRVRDGRLQATRGPHGAYYVAEQDLVELPVPRRGWPLRRTFTKDQREASWDLVDAILSPAKEWSKRELALVGELRASPAANTRLYRLISVHRLRKLGLAFEDIGEELGITARHARRLFGRRVFIALRRHLTRGDRAAAKRERELARRQSRLGRRGGGRWRRQSESAP